MKPVQYSLGSRFDLGKWDLSQTAMTGLPGQFELATQRRHQATQVAGNQSGCQRVWATGVL